MIFRRASAPTPAIGYTFRMSEREKFNTRKMTRRSFTRDALSHTALTSLALSVNPLSLRPDELPEGMDLEDVVKNFFTACESEEQESVALIVQNGEHASRGHNIDIRSSLNTKERDSVELITSLTAQRIYDTLLKLKITRGATLIHAHTHPIFTIRAECPAELCEHIDSRINAYPSMPSPKDMIMYRNNILGESLQREADDRNEFFSQEHIRIRYCVFTNVGTFILEALDESDPRFALFTNQETDDSLEEEWNVINRTWMLHVNDALKTRATWRNILKSAPYIQMQSYITRAFGLKVVFVPRKETTAQIILEQKL